MCNYRYKLGSILVALFFALPLVATPVYANDTIDEPGTGAGQEWSGEIVDPTPAPQPQPQPTTPEPTPAPAPTPAAPKATPKSVATPVVEETPEEAPEEEAPVEEEAPEEESPVEETTEEETPVEETPEVPEARIPVESEDTIRIKIISLISGITAVLIAILIWAVLRLAKIVKFEKIYKEAIKKSHEVKKSGITRAG